METFYFYGEAYRIPGGWDAVVINGVLFRRWFDGTGQTRWQKVEG